MNSATHTDEQLRDEVADLRARLQEANETLRAVRIGEVDAVVVQGPQGDQVFTLTGADEPYRVLIEEMNQGAVTLSADGSILYCNRRFADLLKTPIEEIVGSDFSTFVTLSEQAGFAALLEAARVGGSIAEITLCAGDESPLPLQLALGPLPAGSAAAICLIATDITERKRAEEVLRQSEERFRLLVNGVEGCAIFMLSPQGHVATWNNGAERLKGYKADEIIGHHFSCFYPPEDIAQGKPERELRTAREQGQTKDEGWRVRKDKNQFWADVLITALFDKNRCLVGFAKITRDMTERKLIERALYDKNIEYQDAARAKDRFLANMSHELRTPLNGIIGFAEFLVDGKPGVVNSKQKDYLEDILNSGRHLLQLINDVLDLAKMGAGKMEFSPTKFSLASAIEEICAVTKPIAQKKGICLEVKITPQFVDVTLDQQKFKQILYNLISNAIKFTDDGGKVEIRAAMDDAHHFKLVVQDSGIGIKAEEIGRLFKEFEQLGSSATRSYEGTGLGLALTRQIVVAQGGTIDVESEFGKGSSFSVVLPLVMAIV